MNMEQVAFLQFVFGIVMGFTLIAILLVALWVRYQYDNGKLQFSEDPKEYLEKVRK